MADFKNGAESVQKVKILSYARTGEGTKIDKTAVTYTRTDGVGNGSALTAAKFTSDYTAEEKQLIKAALGGTDNGEVVLVKVFEQKEGAPQGYWNLKTLQNVSTYTPKEAKPAYGNTNKKAYVSSGGNSNNNRGGGYNEAGVKAGALTHDAVATAIAQKGTKVTVADIAAIARELATFSAEFEEEIRSGYYTGAKKAANNNNNNKAAASAAPVASGIQEFDSLDDLDSLDIEL